MKLPKNRSKVASYRNKSVSELMGMKISKDHLLDAKTINKHLNRISSVFEWGVANGYMSVNYAKGMLLSRTRRDDEARDPFTDAEINLLKKAVTEGQYDSGKVPWKKWIPLIGMYTGMRLNEICQLCVSDIAEQDGIQIISVNDKEEKRLKNLNSKRVIPVHPALLDAGLPDYVNDLRSKGTKRLFPELSKGRDGYGKTPTRWFQKLRGHLGIEKPFHSLRHTVATKLREAGVPEDLVGDILGHARSGRETFRTYVKEASISRKLDALKQLHF